MLTKEQIERGKALCAAATPGPWREWSQPEGVACVWKDALPAGSVCVESTGTVFALGVAVSASPTAQDAAFIAEARALLPAALDHAEEMERRIAALDVLAKSLRETAAKVRARGGDDEDDALDSRAEIIEHALNHIRGGQ